MKASHTSAEVYARRDETKAVLGIMRRAITMDDYRSVHEYKRDRARQHHADACQCLHRLVQHKHDQATSTNEVDVQLQIKQKSYLLEGKE
jgi:hypothetical protein